jgi:hypothetical protein
LRDIGKNLLGTMLGQWCGLKFGPVALALRLCQAVAMKSRNKRDLEKHWAEHTKKASVQGRVPKKGDRVGANGRIGVFAVVEVRRIPKVVDLQSLKGGPVEKGIPWTALTFMDKEEAGQAAARIVREPTTEK